MHHCLQVSELIKLIFIYLSDTDLVSATLTCRAWKPVSLPLLWRNLRSLSPVIRSLPQDTWSVSTVHRKRHITNEEFVLGRDILPNDWDRALPYLAMIRSINAFANEGRKQVRIPDQLFESMTTSMPTTALFPNLRSFALHRNCTDGTLKFLRSILGPQLRSLQLDLTVASSEETRTSLIRAIPTACPMLTNLDLGKGSLALPAISEAICQLQNLEDLTVPDLSDAAFVHLSQLPRLRRLLITWESNRIENSTQLLPGSAFPVLAELEVGEGSLAFYTKLLQRITSPFFNFSDTNVVFLRESATAEDWSRFFTQLASMSKKPNGLDIGYNDKPPIHHLGPVPSDVLRPLLSFAHLETIDMEGVPELDLDDDFVLELAEACPKLNYLVIGTQWSTGRRSSATLMSYVYLLEHCADLCIIGLVVDASTVTRNLRVNPAKNIKKTLNPDKDASIKVGDSYIEDPVAVAAFLSALVDLNCDEELSIYTAEDCPDDVEDMWASVQQLIPSYVAVRAQSNSDQG